MLKKKLFSLHPTVNSFVANPFCFALHFCTTFKLELQTRRNLKVIAD